MGTSHPLSVGSNNHAVTANPNSTGAAYTDIAARDADTAFQITSNINKAVRVDSPEIEIYILLNVGPTVWSPGIFGTAFNTFLELLDVFETSYTGKGTQLIGVNSAETGLNFKGVKVNDSGELDLVSQKIINLLDPTNPQDAATRQFVLDNVALFDTFLELTDTPASYSGNALQVIRVNVGETALEFSSAGMGTVTSTGTINTGAIPSYFDATGNIIEDKNSAKMSTAGIDLNPTKSLYQEVYPNTDKQVLSLSLQDKLDRSPFGNDLSLEGAAAIVQGAGRIGKGLRLDGTTGTLARVQDNTSLQFIDALSVEAWIFPNGTGAGFETIISKNDINAAINSGWAINYNNNALRITFRDGVGNTSDNGGIGVIPTSQWSNIAATFLASTNELIVYINGVALTPIITTEVYMDSGDDLILGGRLSNGIPTLGNEFDGDISNVRVYNRILASEEIRTHYLQASQFLNQSAQIANRLKITDLSDNTWLNFNNVNRLPSRIGVQTFEIFSEADFPNAPSGGIINLDSGRYIFKDNYTSSNRFVINAGQDVTIGSEAAFATFVTYTGTGAFFSGMFVAAFTLAPSLIFLAGNNAKLIEFSFSGLVILEGASLTWAGTGTRTIGDAADSFALDIRDCDFNDYIEGLTASNMFFFAVDGIQLLGTGAGTDALIKIEGSLSLSRIDTVAVTTGASESVIFINPNIGDQSSIQMRTVSDIGVGSFFKSGTTGAITLFANSTIGATSVNSVSSGTAIPAGGNYARFNITGVDVFVGQQVTTVSFAGEASYNQVLIVTVTGAGFFEGNIKSTGFPISFIANDTGLYLADSITVTSTAHGLSELEALLITGTIFYNAGYTIYNVLTNTFQINKIFIIAETTGTWDTGSLTQKDKRVDLKESPPQQDSMNIAFGGMNANSTATVIASADTYQAMDFDTMVQDPSTELWTLIDSTAGIFRYDGSTPVAGSLTASITVVKSGGTVVYRFTDSINSVVPTFATQPYVPVEVKATQIGATLIRPINVVPGDTIQIMGAAQGSTDSITVTDFFMQVII